MQECENQKRITAVAIGDFDGMHRAHNIVCTGAERVIIYCVHNRFSLLQRAFSSVATRRRCLRILMPFAIWKVGSLWRMC